MEVIVDDKDADAVVRAICEAARTGKIGDGKYWTIPLETLGRIRTGEIGPEAL